jgi:archaemetzincin
VLLVGLGDLPPRLLPEVAAGVKAVFGLGWRAGPSLDRPAYAFNEVRRQYNAPAILRRLSALRSAPGVPVLGLLDGDLFLPDDAEFILADADRDAGAAVVALGRLRGDPPAARRRVQVEAVHALGHVLGLSPCSDGKCAMFPSRDAADSDRKGAGLCASCRAALGLP